MAEPQQSRYGGRYVVVVESEPEPPFRRPKHPCYECCGSIRTGVLIWINLFWIFGIFLFIALCLVFADSDTLRAGALGWVSFCSIKVGQGGAISAFLTTLTYFAAVIALTVAMFGSCLSPKTRICVTKVFYVFFPLFLVLALVTLIFNMVEGCYDFDNKREVTFLVINIICRVALTICLLFDMVILGRATIYCIKVEEFYKNGTIYEEGRQGQSQSRAASNRQLNA